MKKKKKFYPPETVYYFLRTRRTRTSHTIKKKKNKKNARINTTRVFHSVGRSGLAHISIRFVRIVFFPPFFSFLTQCFTRRHCAFFGNRTVVINIMFFFFFRIYRKYFGFRNEPIRFS